MRGVFRQAVRSCYVCLCVPGGQLVSSGHNVRRLRRGRYEIQAIETRDLDQGEVPEIFWERDNGPDAITEAEIPF